MTPRRTRRIVLALVLVQVLLLVGMPLLRGARIASGTEVRLRVEPVDPTDIARGSYVALDYGFADLRVPKAAQPGDEVSIELRGGRTRGSAPATTGRVVLDAADLPTDAIWIRLRIDDDRLVTTEPIGTWYASSGAAKSVERELADGRAVAVVSLDSDGTPSLVDVKPG